MNPSCYQLNPLQRGGTSQDQRYLAALLTHTALVDSRDIKDLITFVDDYATLLAYYNQQNQWEGDWQSFMRSDPLTFLARIGRKAYKAEYNTISEKYHKALYKLRYELTDEQNNDLSPEAYREHIAKQYQPLFRYIFQLFQKIEVDLYQLVPVNIALKTQIANEISSQLRQDLHSLIAYYKGGSYPNSPSGNDPGALVQAGLLSDIINLSFSNIWIAPPYTGENWEDYCNNIQANRDIYGSATWEIWQRIEYSLTAVKAIFKRAYAAYIRIINQSDIFFQESLHHAADHPPHMTLLLTFLQLFQDVQQDLNQLVESHLHFYFRDSLQLREKPATPDQVHLLITLAKQQQVDYRIEAGRELKAGKDKTGKDLIYQVTEDWLINQGAVASFNPEFLLNSQPLQRQIVKGDSLKAPQWQYFELSSSSGSASPSSQALLEVGWAIASPILRLKEGQRTITLTFHRASRFLLASKPSLAVNLQNDLDRQSNDNLKKYLNKHLKLYLSAEKQWVVLTPITSIKLLSMENENFQQKRKTDHLEITFFLDESIPSIVDYDPKIHTRETVAEPFNTEWPIAVFVLKQDQFYLDSREILNDFIVDRLEIKVNVHNFKALILQNELGMVDPSKPFQPFGFRPSVGSTLYIGCQEALSKPLTSLGIHIEWMGLPTTSFQTHYSYNKDPLQVKTPETTGYLYLKGQDQTSLKNIDFKGRLAILNRGVWSSSPSEQSLFSEKIEASPEIPSQSRLTLDWQTPLQLVPNLPFYDRYSLEVKGGFLRLELSAPSDAFGHALFQNLYVQQMIAMTRPTAPEGLTLPHEPYTPTIRLLTLSYTAKATIPVQHLSQRKTPEQLFQIYPTGIQPLKEDVDKIRLLAPMSPQLAQQPSGAETLTHMSLDRPALYIGIQDIQPQQTLSMLFQILEGSENASLDPPNIRWFYLAEQTWKPLIQSEQILEDTTKGLQESGIIRFLIPDDATNHHTLLKESAGLYWLRAEIEQPHEKAFYQALPQLVDVQAQAIRATFVNHNNDPQHLAIPLEAGKITKFVLPNAAIKEIRQPYPSFGGQMAESSTTFNHRVSERLRHKQRAMTIWDYERLTLEKFPFLYKVKCLNHTNDFNHINHSGQSDATEIAPGCVCIVVVPDIRQKVYGERFQPQVGNRDRQKITDFLRGISPPYIELKVENPRYEAIKVTCEVAFKMEPDIGRLNSDIQRFLAPWAFDTAQSLEFGRSLHQSQVIKFIEDLPYINYVRTLELRVYLTSSKQPSQTLEEVIASTSRSILTTVFSHDLTFVIKPSL